MGFPIKTDMNNYGLVANVKIPIPPESVGIVPLNTHEFCYALLSFTPYHYAKHLLDPALKTAMEKVSAFLRDAIHTLKDRHGKYIEPIKVALVSEWEKGHFIPNEIQQSLADQADIECRDDYKFFQFDAIQFKSDEPNGYHKIQFLFPKSPAPLSSFEKRRFPQNSLDVDEAVQRFISPSKKRATNERDAFLHSPTTSGSFPPFWLNSPTYAQRASDQPPSPNKYVPFRDGDSSE